MWAQILSDDIYKAINPEWCKIIKETEEKLSGQGAQGKLHQLYEKTERYYKGQIPKVSFETFYRFFVQIGISYAEDAGMNMDGIYMDMDGSLAANIVHAIAKIPIRCLIQEIHDCKDTGKLHGDTYEQEYVCYESCFLEEPGYIRELCRKYPEMLRLILLKISQVVEEIEEILDALRREKNQIITDLMSGSVFGKISRLTLGRSDSHQGGHTVAEVELDNGMKVIYRPAPIEKNKSYEQIYSWLMVESGLRASSRRFLSFRTHSWEEYVESMSCRSEEEVRNYYFRSGVLLFLCYLTFSSDIHGENIIARGEYPELIDLETMPGNRREYGELTEKMLLKRFVDSSVLHTGFLPVQFWGENGGEGALSALHSAGMVKTSIKVPRLHNPYSSKIEIRHEQGTVDVENSTVRINGQGVNAQEYIGEVCAGFCHAYRRTALRKDEMFELFRNMDSQKSRYLIRHTQQYDMYLNTSFFPEFMKKMENRIYLLHVLKKRKSFEGYTEEMFQSELLSLLNMDIPIYYFQRDAVNLLLTDGRECIDYFGKSSRQCVEEHIRSLCEADFFRQEMLIRMSMGCNLPEVNGSRDIEVNGKDSFCLNSMETLGNLILQWKIKEGEITSYLSMRFSDAEWSAKPMDMSLYDGVPGLAVCFALLSSHTENMHFTDECEELCARMFGYTDEVLDKGKDTESAGTGMFAGEGSMVYGYLILYKILKRPEFLEYAEKHATIVGNLVEKDENYDLLSGNAGWIIVLLKLYELSGRYQYLNLATATERILWERRVEFTNSVGWICKDEGVALSGMSHGNSGVILAYSYLLKHTGKTEYRERICLMLKYEDTLYSEKEANWRDLRKKDNLCYYTNVWCHGGSGILLSRLALLQLEQFQNDDFVKEDIKRGLRCLSQWGQEERLSVCHGLTGIYLIYRACGRVLKEIDYNLEAKKIRKRILETKEMKIQEFGSVALMSGISGLVFALCETEDEIFW